MLSEQELLQICSRYELACPVCETKNDYFRLKRDMARGVETEGDGHPLTYKWGKPGFDSIDPLQFFWGVCQKCRFTGDLNDAEFRQADRMIKEYRATLHGDGLRQLLMAAATGKGIAQSLGKRLDDRDIMVQAIAKFHLGIYSTCLRLNLSPGNLARYYLRIAWLFRDQERFYPDSDLESVSSKFVKLRKRFKGELPAHKDYPILPGIALSEVEALRFSRTYFERNYETLREAKNEDELRLSLLLAEIGFRLYELTDDAEDYKKTAAYFSGTMQKCLSIVNDKSIVGGAVNRAKEVLEVAGERGRVLRALNKDRGGSGKSAQAGTPNPKKKTREGAKNGGTKARPQPEAAPAVAEVQNGKEEVIAAANGSNGDSDQATRKLSILQGEVETLRERIKNLEDDNKKWRQLAGRDAVTGLPNKVTLLRLILPKALQELGKGGTCSFIGISLDHVARVNEGHGWVMGDKMLKESVRSLRHFVVDGDELYRLDGAHFAIVGKMDNNMARQRAADIRRKLSRASVQVDKTQLPLMSSVGVVTVDRIISESVNKSSDSIFQALLATLYRAKEKGGNTVEIHHATKF